MLRAPKTAKKTPKEGGTKRKSPSSKGEDDGKGKGKAKAKGQGAGPGQGKSSDPNNPSGRPKDSRFKFSHVSPTSGKKRFKRTDGGGSINAEGCDILSADEPGADQKPQVDSRLDDMNETVELVNNQNHDLTVKIETLERLALQYHKEQLAYIERLHDYANSQISVVEVLKDDYTPKPAPTAPTTPAWLAGIEEKANKQASEALDLTI